MKLLDYFKDFLDDEVDLNATRLSRLNGHVESITNYLEASSTFGDHFVDTIPQGSYAHKTIIKPVQEGDEFDADILLHVNEIEGWEAKDYVNNLLKCFQASGIYKEKAGPKVRCVTIDYARDFHVDVVPYFERGGFKYITNRRDNQPERTDPQAYNAWLSEKNKIANRHLVKVLRLLKFLRDYHDSFDVKSFVLNVLVGSQVYDTSILGGENPYDDVPTTLRLVMNSLAEYLRPLTYLPVILDPSGTGEDLGLRWNQTAYAKFRAAVLRFAPLIEDAYTDTGVSTSLVKWQKVFGASFKKSATAKAQALARFSSSLPVRFTDTEQHLDTNLRIPFRINRFYRVRLSGRVAGLPGRKPFYLHERGNKVLRGRSITFKVEGCSVPEPYRCFWKVLNRGEVAKEQDSIRGQIEEGGLEWKRAETTSFRGPHFVEVYIVKDGACVAMDRQEVMIL